MKGFKSFFSFILMLGMACASGNVFGISQDKNDSTRVYILPMREQVGPALWRITEKGFEEAESFDADIILIHLNTYGGFVDAADSIRTRILNSKRPVYVFIDNNAASAGALISLACDSIYMRPGANIGAATVVNQQGEVVPDKFQSYMRSQMRSTAEAQGKDTLMVDGEKKLVWRRDPKIAEAMVDPSIYIAGIIDTGKVLTFTAREAIANHFAEGQANSIEEVLEQVNANQPIIKTLEMKAIDKVVGFLVNPILQSILIMIIIGGIYFELQTPGIGFPIAASILAAIMYFAPLYLEGLAENWELLVFIGGLILIALELFVIPGFGVAGISGIILTITGLSLSMVGNVAFDFSGVEMNGVFSAFAIVTASMFFSLILSLYLGKKLLVDTPFKSFVLSSVQKKEEGFIGVDSSESRLIGKEGIAYTMLRPSGKVMVDDEVYDAVANVSYIDKGAAILVVKHETGQLYVKKKK